MLRGPPYSSRREAFVDLALNYAADDSHGYSQKPPSGRWGPDYDCSSLLYMLANEAGYPVGTGGDKVRFTGTMLKDFEKAGFQILPFANVGISDLEIGDILLNLALHAEVYVGNGESVGATGSETGGYVGEAGDQTGREIERQPSQPMQAGPDSPMQRMIFNMLYQRNPQFRQLADSVRGQDPQQACQNLGYDYNQLQNVDVNQVKRMFGV